MIINLNINGITTKVVSEDMSLEETRKKYESEMIKVDSIELTFSGTEDFNFAKRTLDNEGTGYAVQHFCSAYDFKDPQIIALWENACNILNKLESYVDSKLDEDFDIDYLWVKSLNNI